MRNYPASVEQATKYLRPIAVVVALGGLAYTTAINADAKQPAKAKYTESGSAGSPKFIIPGLDANNCKFERFPLTGEGWPKLDSIEGTIECPEGTISEVSTEFEYRSPGQGWHEINGHGQTVEASISNSGTSTTATRTLNVPTKYLHELHDKGDKLRWEVIYKSANYAAISSAVIAATDVEGGVSKDYFSPGTQH